MNDTNAFSVISDLQIELYRLRRVSLLAKALYTALEKGDDDPEVFFPCVYEIHRQLDDLADRMDAACTSYFDALPSASGDEGGSV